MNTLMGSHAQREMVYPHVKNYGYSERGVMTRSDRNAQETPLDTTEEKIF
jgi:hypothetical protein